MDDELKALSDDLLSLLRDENFQAVEEPSIGPYRAAMMMPLPQRVFAVLVVDAISVILAGELNCGRRSFRPGKHKNDAPISFQYTNRRDKAREKALRWVASNDDSNPFTFINACEISGIAPSYLRKFITKKTGIEFQPLPRKRNSANLGWFRARRRSLTGDSSLLEQNSLYKLGTILFRNGYRGREKL